MGLNAVHNLGERTDKEFQTLLSVSVDQMVNDFEAGEPLQIRNEYLVASTEITTTGVVHAVDLGIGDGYVIASLEGVQDHYMRTPYKGGVLSERLYKNARKAQVAVVETVNAHTKARTSWQTLAKAVNRPDLRADQLPAYIDNVRDAFETYGAGSKQLKAALKTAERNIARLSNAEGITRSNLRRAYKDVVKAAEKGEKAILEAKLTDALQRKAINNSQMLAKSEISRTYFEGFQRRLREEPGAVGWRSLLSPAHPRPDICNFMAEVDGYGMGAGVSPLAYGVPIGYHPRCICMCEVVYDWELEGKRPGPFRAEAGEEYLATIPYKEQKAMLGVSGAENIAAWPQNLRSWTPPGQLVATPAELITQA